jgi:SAM-dependent methyltransferase
MNPSEQPRTVSAVLPHVRGESPHGWLPRSFEAARSRRPIASVVATALFCLPVIGQDQRSPDIHFAATPHSVADAMLTLARVTARDVVYDLGSGDGRIVIMAAQKYGARGVGIELNRGLVEVSRQVARDGDVADRVSFVEGDLFTADISAATVVTLWLSATVNSRLEPKLKGELRPGTRLVSRQFPIGNWAPQATVRLEGEELFFWTIPDRQ